MAGGRGWIGIGSFVVASVIGGVIPASGDLAAQESPRPFAVGVVTVEGESLYRGTFSPDGDSFWYFRRIGDEGQNYRIHRARRGADGEWSSSERVDLGGDHSDLYPTVSPDGSLLVFTSYRETPVGGAPNANLWMSRRQEDGSWGEPEYLEALSITENYDSGPLWIGDELHWRSTLPDWRTERSRRARWTGTGFELLPDREDLSLWADWRPETHHIWHSVEAPGGDLRLIEISELGADGRRGPSDLWLSRLGSDGWSDPMPLGGGINGADAYDNFVTFTPDGSRMIWVRGFSEAYSIDVSALLRYAGE